MRREHKQALFAVAFLVSVAGALWAIGPFQTARMSDSTRVIDVDDNVNALENAIIGLFGIPAGTNINSAVFAIDTDGHITTAPRTRDGIRFENAAGTLEFLLTADTGDPSSWMDLKYNTGSESAPSWQTAVTFNSDGRVTLGSDPTGSMDAATKGYVDAAVGNRTPDYLYGQSDPFSVPAHSAGSAVVLATVWDQNGITVAGAPNNHQVTLSRDGVYEITLTGNCTGAGDTGAGWTFGGYNGSSITPVVDMGSQEHPGGIAVRGLVHNAYAWYAFYLTNDSDFSLSCSEVHVTLARLGGLP